MNEEKTYDWTTDYRTELGYDVPCVIVGTCCEKRWSAWNAIHQIPVACPMCGAKITNEPLKH